jgi:hypothetical protein
MLSLKIGSVFNRAAETALNTRNCTMPNIATKQPDHKPLPDVYAESGDDGYTTIVANRRARKLINKHFEKPRPLWGCVGGDVFTSPEYRAVGIGDGPVPQVLLAVAHQAGMKAMFKCLSCPQLHTMTDETAARFLKEAEASAERVGAHPGVGTLQ